MTQPAWFSTQEGQTLDLVGESGPGTSTTARMLIGLKKPASCSIRFDALAVSVAAKWIGLGCGGRC